MRVQAAILALAAIAPAHAAVLPAVSAPPSQASVSTAAVSSLLPSPATPSGWAAAYTPPSAFPTSGYESFYQTPAGTTVEPRPAVVDAVPLDPHAPHYFPDLNPSALPTTAPTASPGVIPLPSSTISGNGPSSTASAINTLEASIAELVATNASSTTEQCRLCKHGLTLGQAFVRQYPDAVPQLLGDLCSKYQAPSKVGKTYATLAESQEACYLNYNPSVLGGAYAAVLSYANLTPSINSGDGDSDAQAVCYSALKLCPAPAPLNFTQSYLHDWFSKSNTSTSVPLEALMQSTEYREKRDALRAKSASGLADFEPVAHLSDIHLDPRFQPGTEASCTTGQCCRTDSWNTSVTTAPPSSFPGGVLPQGNVSEAAQYWGNYECDSPWSLVANMFETVQQVLPKGKQLALSLFTGDMVTHEGSANWHLTRDLLLYVQQGLVDLMARYLGPGPTMLTLGNHDTVPDDFVPVGTLPNERGQELQWEWDHIAELIKSKGWLDGEALESVRKHSSGFSALVHPGNRSDTLDVPPLRIISLNADMWYSSNVYTLIDSHNPDRSGMLRWVTDELLHAEQKGEKVWIMGHVLPAWSGTNAWANPTQLFHAIVDRFSSTSLAHIFFGHTHEDQSSVFYPFHPAVSPTQNSPAPAAGKNGSSMPIDTARSARNVAFMAPSVTPGTHLNPEFRIYTVDPHGWVVMDIEQYASRLQDVAAGFTPSPVWELLYSARETYGHFTSLQADGSYAGSVALGGADGATWPAHVPLNGTFWAALTDEMVLRPSLVALHTALSSGNSTTFEPCTDGECLPAKICYIRAGDARQGSECIKGYDSVQG